MSMKVGVSQIHAPGGSSLTIEQEDFRRAPDRHRFVFDLRATHQASGKSSTRRATMLISAEALESLPGDDDAAKSRAINGALAGWLGENVLNDGDVLRITVDDFGVGISRES